MTKTTSLKRFDVSHHVVCRIKEIRKANGWNLIKLAGRCTEVDAPWLTFYVLQQIERTPALGGTRRRRVSVEDLVALAAALEVSPADLLPGPSTTPSAQAAAVDIATVRRLTNELHRQLNPAGDDRGA